jgi:catechol 2,3-dioxygenase-like lactoylglutathione lyase family enzyme
MADRSIFKHEGRLGGSTELDAVGKPSLKHIGLFVRDIGATVEELSRIWGVESWERYDLTPPQSSVTVGNTFRLKVAKAYILGLLFQICQPIDDVDIFAETSPVWGKFLQKSFGGIQHVCVSVDNWERVVNRVVENGGRIYKCLSQGGKRCAHIEGEIGSMAIAIEERTALRVPAAKASSVYNLGGKIGGTAELDAIAQPTLQHLGIYVRDRNTFMRYISKVWGVSEWETLEFIPPQQAMVVGNSVKLGMANTNVLGLLLHVSERLDDADTFAEMSPVWAEWERTRGEGHYHLCLSVDSWEQVVDIVKSRGAHLFASSSYEGRRWAHFLCPVTSLNIEIEERPEP